MKVNSDGHIEYRLKTQSDPEVISVITNSKFAIILQAVWLLYCIHPLSCVMS